MRIPTLQLQTLMQQPQWADGSWRSHRLMTSQNLSNAQIKLNPAHLGPIDVQISVADDQTTCFDDRPASAPRATH